jgi:MFS family permease
MVLGAYGFRALFAGTVLLGVGTLAVCLVTEVPAPMAVETPRALGPGFWRAFAPVIIASFQFGLANSIVFVFLPPFARYVGLPRIGPFYITYTLMAVAVRFLGGRLADRLERRQVILPALVALSIGVLLFSGLRSTWMLILIAFINGTAHGFVYPAASAMAFDRAPSGARGRALAIFNTAVLAGVTTGAVGFGWLVELVGYRPSFIALGLLLACGAGVFWRKR